MTKTKTLDKLKKRLNLSTAQDSRPTATPTSCVASLHRYQLSG